MLGSMRLPVRGGLEVNRSASSRPAVARSGRAVAVTCKATAWDSWTSYIAKHRTDSAASTATSSESSYSKELAAAIRSSAAGFTSKYTSQVGAGDHGNGTSDFHLSHIGAKKDFDELPKDLHERLEAIALVQLKEALGMADKELDAASISFTTSDVDGALCVSGVTLQQGLDKTAYVAMVACETERPASWSRLEGLMLHWGCSDSATGSWGLPPQGWVAIPNKVMDAGGAWQCTFEKMMVSSPDGNTAVYVLLLSMPLRGILKSGGIVYVLKASAGQNTRWLKDAVTTKDFFVDLTRLPVIKA